MIDLTPVKFLACLKEPIDYVIAQPVATIVKCVLPMMIAQLTGPRSLRWTRNVSFSLAIPFRAKSWHVCCMNKDKNEETLIRHSFITVIVFAFYFYLLGTMFLLLDSYAGVTKLPPARSAYSVCHYHQVYLPEEAMALQARGRGMSYLSGGVAKHHRKNVIHFIVAKQLGNNEK